MVSYLPRNLTASATLTLADADSPITINAAAGLTVTLPAATGSGAKFSMMIGTTVTSNSVVIRVASASDWYAGAIWAATDNASDVTVAFETATGAIGSRSDTITLNGSTTGGLAGDRFDFTDIGSGQWELTGWMSATGTEATPLSATI